MNGLLTFPPTFFLLEIRRQVACDKREADVVHFDFADDNSAKTWIIFVTHIPATQAITDLAPRSTL